MIVVIFEVWPAQGRQAATRTLRPRAFLENFLDATKRRTWFPFEASLTRDRSGH
jgi:hypothetical protein